MADRSIYKSRKDLAGVISAIGGSGGESWSPRLKSDAIDDIEFGLHTYHVPWTTGRTEIRVVQGATGKYLRTDHDGTARNNLLDLPDC